MCIRSLFIHFICRTIISPNIQTFLIHSTPTHTQSVCLCRLSFRAAKRAKTYFNTLFIRAAFRAHTPIIVPTTHHSIAIVVPILFSRNRPRKNRPSASILDNWRSGRRRMVPDADDDDDERLTCLKTFSGVVFLRSTGEGVLGV